MWRFDVFNDLYAQQRIISTVMFTEVSRHEVITNSTCDDTFMLSKAILQTSFCTLYLKKPVDMC